MTNDVLPLSPEELVDFRSELPGQITALSLEGGKFDMVSALYIPRLLATIDSAQQAAAEALNLNQPHLPTNSVRVDLDTYQSLQESAAEAERKLGVVRAAVIEECAAKVRDACPACGGSGYEEYQSRPEDEPRQCQYCGVPMHAIYSITSPAKAEAEQ